MSKPHPFGQWLLSLVLHPIDRDFVLGDLEEAYRYKVQHHGKVSAERWYWYQVIHSIPSLISRSSYWNIVMLKNYLKIALRNLRKQKGYAFINIFGLAAGLACFIMILLFAQHELSYDQFHEKADQIYHVGQRRPTPSGPNYWAVTSPAMANTLVGAYAEIEIATTVGKTYDPLLSLDENHFQEEGILADRHFLDMFTFPMIQGNAATALENPNSIILTETLARKIFGVSDPMGQSLVYQNKEAFVVTGIMADVPKTSHFKFGYILPNQSDFFYRDGLDKPAWYNNGWYTYVLLTKGADAEQMEEKMRLFVDENLADWRAEDRMAFVFQPIRDIHLLSGQMSFGFKAGGDIKYVYLFSAIGFLILLLASVNYMNLAIARSIKRAKEVGMRKVIGAERGQLISQFLGESVLMAFLALILSIGMVHLLLPFFGNLVERPLQMNYISNGLLLPGLLMLVILVGILAGSYPALFMSALRPIQVLKGKVVNRRSRFGLQRLLIVGQYVVSIVLVAGSLVVYEQIQYVQQQELGYNRDHVVTVRASDESLSRNYDYIRETWLRDPRVIAVSYSKHLPINVGNTQSIYGWEGSEGELLPSMTTSVDYDFLDVYDIEIITGRAFSRAFSTDTLGTALISETAVHALGWTPETALGKQFGFSDGRGRRTVIGVMKDFHFNSIHDEIEPLVLTPEKNPTGYISAKVRPEDLPGVIALFEETVKQFTPFPFQYQFIDESFDELYKRDVRLGETFGFFTLLALLIASLGLFGLAAYAAEQRTKEIGVRKVLGASVSSIALMLTKEFTMLVVVAAVLATPVAYFAMSHWLESFAYHIDLGPKLFLLTIGLTLSIALFTVCYHTLKAAVANPVKSLNYD